MRKLNYHCLGNHHLDHLITFPDAYKEVQTSHYTCVSAATSKETQDVSSFIMPVTSPPVSSGAHMPFQKLPEPLTPLLMREQELQVTRARLLRPHVRLLTLVGTPGVGKTRLALALGAQVREDFTQGICFVCLSCIDNPALVLPAIAQTFRLPCEGTLPVLEQLKIFLHDKHLLLLLDTFEHVLPAAPQLVELLASCPLLKMVVTSRAILHVEGEYVFSVSPLALPDLYSLPSIDTLAQIASVALFVERAEALQSGFALTEDNAPIVAKLCVQLEGVPLAIELAAARSNLLSLQALSACLDLSGDVLTGGRRDVPVHQQSLYNTINWSYDLLSPAEQTLFRCLCILEKAFTLEEAAAVATASEKLSISLLGGLATLVDKSLLLRCERDEHEPLFYMLKIIRIYGLKRLAASGELEQCRKALSYYSSAEAEQCKKAMGASSAQDIHPDAPTRQHHLPHSQAMKLTTREIEVLRLLAAGLSNNQIAERLSVSPFTVNRHAQSIYNKLGVNSRCAATRFAIEHQLL